MIYLPRLLILITLLFFHVHDYLQPRASSRATQSERNRLQKPVVLLDVYFNNEWKQTSSGDKYRFHYTWDDTTNSGFFVLGELFKRSGAEIQQLESAPNKKNLKKAAIYIIVDPDTEKETMHPNFMTDAYANTIASWVKAGGLLVLMANDLNNAELKNFNTLSSRFGIRFNEDNFNQVINNRYEQGSISISTGHQIFKTSRNLFIKELSTLQVNEPAVSVLTKEGKNVIAVSKYGKGTVFAIGDPWLYNEYIDNRRLPSEFENYKAAVDLIDWLYLQTKKRNNK